MRKFLSTDNETSVLAHEIFNNLAPESLQKTVTAIQSIRIKDHARGFVAGAVASAVVIGVASITNRNNHSHH